MTNIIKHQSMRIAGKKVDAEKNINVHYPYTMNNWHSASWEC